MAKVKLQYIHRGDVRRRLGISEDKVAEFVEQGVLKPLSLVDLVEMGVLRSAMGRHPKRPFFFNSIEVEAAKKHLT